MAEHDTDVEDAASLMEKLWGPRDQAPPDAVVVPIGDLWGPGRGVELPQLRRVATASAPTAASESTAADSAAPDPEALREGIEAGVTERLASLRAELLSAVASVDERLNRRADALAAEMAAADAARRAAVPTEDVMAAAEERAAMVESNVRARLDDLREQVRGELGVLAGSIPDPEVARAGLDDHLAPLRAELAAAAARAAESEARLLLRLEDISNRVAAVDDRLDAEVGRVAAALGRVEASSATGAELQAVRGVIEDGLGEARGLLQSAQVETAMRLEEVRSGLKGPADAVAGSVAELERRLDHLSAATTRLVDSGRADHIAVQSLHHRLGLARAELPLRLERALEELRGRTASREDLAAVRSELKRLLSRRLAPIEAEARRIAGVLDDVTAGTVEQVVDRLDEMAAWVLAQATRAAERVAADAVTLTRQRRQVRAVKVGVDSDVAAVTGSRGRVLPSARRSTSFPAAGGAHAERHRREA